MNYKFAKSKRTIANFALATCLIASSLPSTALVQGLPAEVVHAKEQSIPTYIEAIGTLKANESLILRPENTGRVDAIRFTEGSFVKKGSPLVASSGLYLFL
jgi:membrane fusion protein (multidrug efflux system)